MSRAIKKVADQLNQSRVERGRIYAIDGDRVDLQIGTSPSVVRNIEVIGSVDHLKPGDEVVFARVDGRPVVLAGGAAVYTVVSGQANEPVSDVPAHGHEGPADGGILPYYISRAEHAGMGLHSYSTNLPHDSHGMLLDLEGDHHLNYLHLLNPRLIRAVHTFAPDTPEPPFTLSANAMGRTVVGFRADELNKSVLAGHGLLGGGMLTADRTLAVNENYNFIWTGNHTFKMPMVTSDILPDLPDTRVIGSFERPFASGVLSELNAFLLANRVVTVVGGVLVVGKNEGKLPSGILSTDTEIDFGMEMDVGDFVLFRTSLRMEYMQVLSHQGDYVYAVQRDLDGTGAHDWPEGTVFQVLGNEGDGRVEIRAMGSPRMTVLSQGNEYNKQFPHVAAGHLGSLLGLPANTDEYGFAAGLDLSDVNAAYIKATNKGVTLQKVDIDLKSDSNTQSGKISANGDFWFGKDANNKSIQHDAATGNLEIGKFDGGSGIKWDQGTQSLNIRGQVSVNGLGFLTDALLYCAFDGPEPLYANYSGSPAGHNGSMPVVNGGVIFRPGKYGKAVQIAEATTNLLRYTSFETGALLDGWTAASGGFPHAIAPETDRVLFGQRSARIRFDEDTVTRGMVQTFTAPADGTYTFSGYIWIINYTEGRLVMDLGAGSPRAIFEGVTDGWVRFSVTHTLTAGTRQARIFTDSTPRFVGRFILDGLQVEQRSYPSPYCDGSLGSGHSWSGTPFVSTSSRQPANLVYTRPQGITDQLTVSCWIYLFDEKSDGRRAIFYNNDASAEVYMRVHNRKLQASWNGATATSTVEIPTYTWTHVAMTMDGSYLRIYINGSLAGQAAASGVMSANSTQIVVGSHYTNRTTYNLSGLIDDMCFIGRRLSDADIMTIATSPEPINVRHGNFDLMLGGGAGNGHILGSGDGLVGYDASGVKQVEFLTDGRIYAANRNIRIDGEGYWIKVGQDGSGNPLYGKMGDQIGGGASRTAVQSIPRATPRAVYFDKEEFDNPGGFVTVPFTSSSNTFVIPETGVYLLTAYTEWANNVGAGYYPFVEMRFTIGTSTNAENNTTYARQNLLGPGNGLNYKPAMTLTHVMHLTAGRRVGLVVRIANTDISSINLEVANMSVIKLM